MSAVVDESVAAELNRRFIAPVFAEAKWRKQGFHYHCANGRGDVAAVSMRMSHGNEGTRTARFFIEVGVSPAAYIAHERGGKRFGAEQQLFAGRLLVPEGVEGGGGMWNVGANETDRSGPVLSATMQTSIPVLLGMLNYDLLLAHVQAQQRPVPVQSLLPPITGSWDPVFAPKAEILLTAHQGWSPRMDELLHQVEGYGRPTSTARIRAILASPFPDRYLTDTSG